MPTYDYNPIRIQNFLTNHVDLQGFCFVLGFEVNPNYAYRHLAGPTPAARSQNLVLQAKSNGQLGEVVFQLADYWINNVFGNPQVLASAGIGEELIVYRQERLDRGDQDKAAQVLVVIQVIIPDYVPPDPGSEPPPPPPDGPFKHGYAALIGVGEHLNRNISPLPATVKDVHAIRDALLDPVRCAYLAEHVHVSTGPSATRQSILGYLDWLADQASRDPQATAIFYFSGHGWKDESVSPSRYCLIPYDCDWDQVGATTVCDDLFTEKLRAIPAERLVVILDACHAGGVASAKDARPLPKGFTQAAPPAAQLFERLGSGGGKVILSSSKEGEQSYVREDQSLSIFTECFVEALSGRPFDGYADPPDEIGILDVFNYLDRHVPDRAKPGQQHPVLGSSQATNFPIALLLGGKGKRGKAGA